MQYPKYYRQRFIMTLLQHLNSGLKGEEFQKILFLSQQETEIFYYDFVSFNHSFHSFQAASDLHLLHQLGWLEIVNDEIKVLHKLPYEKGLRQAEARKLLLFIRGKKYCQEQLFSEKSVKQCRTVFSDRAPVLFTIGYEGISFEEYINRLIEQNVRLLCDVRMNPVSRKFGFSKGRLSELLPTVGIEYLHIPELGIISSKRKYLKTTSDYQRLFASYRKEMMKKKKHLSMLIELMDKYEKIALTCFERKPLFCHRHCISDYLERKNNLKVVHL